MLLGGGRFFVCEVPLEHSETFTPRRDRTHKWVTLRGWPRSEGVGCVESGIVDGCGVVGLEGPLPGGGGLGERVGHAFVRGILVQYTLQRQTDSCADLPAAADVQRAQARWTSVLEREDQDEMSPFRPNF